MTSAIDSNSPYLARIDLYPVKSLDGITVEQAPLLASGALQGDRTFALFDQAGQFINGKRNARVHLLRAHFGQNLTTITLQAPSLPPSPPFHLEQDRPALEHWLSDYFQQPVTVQENTQTGFPDDTESPGPTVISTATLATVATWYGLTLEETRQRFRTNLEIGGVPAFWEDYLFGEADETHPFRIGEVVLLGINPCQRCIVPTRNPLTGEGNSKFQKTFVERRRATLPERVNQTRFNHFYRLAVNTRLPATEANNLLRIGDRVADEIG